MKYTSDQPLHEAFFCLQNLLHGYDPLNGKI